MAGDSQAQHAATAAAAGVGQRAALEDDFANAEFKNFGDKKQVPDNGIPL